MMRALKALFLGLLVLALLNSPATASTFDKADGWYRWSVDSPVNMGSSCCGDMSGELAIYVRSSNGGPVRIRAYDANCDKGPEENVTDLGTLSLAQSDALLLEIVQARNIDMDVREDALFWLVHTGSDETFEYVDHLLSSR
jgi:hypothetical protein